MVEVTWEELQREKRLISVPRERTRISSAELFLIQVPDYLKNAELNLHLNRGGHCVFILEERVLKEN